MPSPSDKPTDAELLFARLKGGFDRVTERKLAGRFPNANLVPDDRMSQPDGDRMVRKPDRRGGR